MADRKSPEGMSDEAVYLVIEKSRDGPGKISGMRWLEPGDIAMHRITGFEAPEAEVAGVARAAEYWVLMKKCAIWERRRFYRDGVIVSAPSLVEKLEIVLDEPNRMPAWPDHGFDPLPRGHLLYLTRDEIKANRVTGFVRAIDWRDGKNRTDVIREEAVNAGCEFFRDGETIETPPPGSQEAKRLPPGNSLAQYLDKFAALDERLSYCGSDAAARANPGFAPPVESGPPEGATRSAGSAGSTGGIVVKGDFPEEVAAFLSEALNHPANVWTVAPSPDGLAIEVRRIGVEKSDA